MENGGYVYILASQPRGTIYIGVTANLLRRLSEHRTGTHEGFTKQHNVKRLVWYEQFADINLAIAREKALKFWKRAWKVQLIETTNPDWHDLAITWGFDPV